MKRISLFSAVLLTALLITSCSKPEVPQQPTAAAPTQTQTPAPVSTPMRTATYTVQPSIDMHAFTVQIDERICALKEVEFYGLYVFQADCGAEIYMAQAQRVTITLVPPNDEIYHISPIPAQEAIFGALEPPFVYGEFADSGLPNSAVFAIPMFKYSGEPILCGFSIPVQGKDVLIVVTGLTTRAL